MPGEPAAVRSACQWAAVLERASRELARDFAPHYGGDEAVLEDRLPLLRQVVAGFIERFGDRPLRLFRSPGRINLRGMHVDTHGGWLNLMTHQRETVVAASVRADAVVDVANIDPLYPPAAINLAEERTRDAFAMPWRSYIGHPETAARVRSDAGHWGNYVRGAVLRAQHNSSAGLLRGFDGVLGSDLPRGAALSSSHALCTVLMHTALGLNGCSLEPAGLIRAIQDAEWYTGARSGLADQGAMVLGAPGALVHVVLHGIHPSLDTLTTHAFPSELCVLVAHSHTERSLSGAQAVDYTRNRFAYSMALEIARQEMRMQGWPSELVEEAGSLASFAPNRLESAGGLAALYRLLRRIPEECTLVELRRRYDLPNLDAAYEQYFAGIPEDRRPREIRLRGPLIYGIAESERARQFPALLKQGDFAAAGALMSTGHNGDRVRFANGMNPFDAGDAALAKLGEDGVDIAACPGEYGASSPVLDALVDGAQEAGALGACLTGAGMAGSVLALCTANDMDRVVRSMAACLGSTGYAALAGWDRPLSGEEAAASVVPNHPTGAAGELTLRD